ncbi:unnamed protein product [Diatraea saccharalis]|uniref:RNA helicase n=1 Tax=Diatraea saccharalis TaxID=40085 RepID=A0A9N9WEL4_9NEOP|nr:unnamed protein product [Diatraea saccharalis]
MSRRGDAWRKQRHGNANASSSWTRNRFRIPHPPGLRGRQIGLFYRDLNKKNKNTKKDHALALRIPKPVITKLMRNLENIATIAKKDNITILPKMISVLFPEKLDNENKVTTKILNDIEENEPSIKLLKTDPSTICAPGPSQTPDFIPIKSEVFQEYGTGERVLSLRGAGDFKYGYKDIITGTFDEKLEECLSKGINITKSNDEITSLNKLFYDEHINRLSNSQYLKMKKFRETLPTYKKSEDLLNVINNNQVVVISGETGCGKSTQVPQIILDHALMNKKGANVKLLITQPRRIAASSLAVRVAKERAESMGVSVGYAVRLEKEEARPRGSMMFCTTGILLVDLETNQGLTDYSHIILDEVHERDCHIDFAMCMLKQVLQKRKDLKLILMSATIDAEKLSAFFNDCPMMHIEGLAYPVKDVYLEEILHLTHFQLKDVPQPKGDHKFRGGRNRAAAAGNEKAIQYRAEIRPWLESIKKNLDPSVYQTLQDHRIEDLNMDLIFEVIKYICRGPPGAILVFLPGIGEITKLLKIIHENESYLGSKCEVHALHSKLPTLEQNKIFESPPSHIRKIIVATNIAETSITIDDIVYVIDCGKIKYNGLNVEQNFTTLKTEWVLQANLRQRRGRAGRCQPGVCYHLVTTYRAGVLEERLLPELQRSNLLEPVLTIKRLRLGKAADAFKNVPDSPSETTVERAVTHLQQCGALDDNETLTPLGWHLARLPVHPAAGKLVLFGALFGCLDRAASVAAVWSFKDPFLLIIDKEDEVKAVKRRLALGEPSDHIAVSEALIQWERCAPYKRRNYAYQNFLSHNTLELLSDMKNQIGDNLKQMGFLSSGRVTSAWENRNTDNLSLFKAIIAASLYPNIATARWTRFNARNPNKPVRVKVKTPEGNVTIHPSSMMSPPKKNPVKPCTNMGANWLVYWLKQKSSDLFVIDVTLVYTLPLLFFGELKVFDNEEDPLFCNISISSYKVNVLKESAELLLELRNLLDQVLASKIMVSSTHSIKHSEFEENVLNAVIAVITAEDERAEYVDDTESDKSECESTSHR